MAKAESTPAGKPAAGRASGLRCKPGGRARIVNGPNVGRIVVVVRQYRPGETLDGASDWAATESPWVAASLAEPLRVFHLRDGVPVRECPPARTIAIEDARLQPLRDDEDGLSSRGNKRRRRSIPAKGKEVAHG